MLSKLLGLLSLLLYTFCLQDYLYPQRYGNARYLNPRNPQSERLPFRPPVRNDDIVDEPLPRRQLEDRSPRRDDNQDTRFGRERRQAAIRPTITGANRQQRQQRTPTRQRPSANINPPDAIRPTANVGPNPRREPDRPPLGTPNPNFRRLATGLPGGGASPPIENGAGNRSPPQATQPWPIQQGNGRGGGGQADWGSPGGPGPAIPLPNNTDTDANSSLTITAIDDSSSSSSSTLISAESVNTSSNMLPNLVIIFGIAIICIVLIILF